MPVAHPGHEGVVEVHVDDEGKARHELKHDVTRVEVVGGYAGLPVSVDRSDKKTALVLEDAEPCSVVEVWYQLPIRLADD